MKIPKDKFHPELKSVHFVGKAYTFLMSNKFGFKLINRAFKGMEGKITKGLVNEKLSIKSNHGGPDIRLRIYKPENNSDRLPVMLYLHGGGYALGTPEQSVDIFKGFMEKRPCVVVAPGYRNSQTKPYPAAFDGLLRYFIMD